MVRGDFDAHGEWLGPRGGDSDTHPSKAMGPRPPARRAARTFDLTWRIRSLAVMETTRPFGKPRSAKGRARAAHALLAEEYPEAECELDHRNAFELLAATIMSAQATDVSVNKVTPALFAAYPTAESMAQADQSDIVEIVGIPQRVGEHEVAVGEAHDAAVFER